MSPKQRPESELAGLTLERKRSVNQIAQHWGKNSLILSPETPRRLEPDRPGLTGSQLISRLLNSAKELLGRVVARNKDDVSFLCKGLEVLSKEWELLEHSLQKSEQSLMQVKLEKGEGASVRSSSLSSPESTDSQFVMKQQRRIQHLEDQEGRLQEELRQLKAKWEAIMARTMEQQASIHRQQMREREELVARKEAEIEELRQHLPAAERSTASKHDKQIAAVRPVHRHEQYLMAGRMMLGQTLQILGPCNENNPDKLQWYRILSPGDWQPISGAKRNQASTCSSSELPLQYKKLVKLEHGTSKESCQAKLLAQYSPEPYDVGFALGCCITPHNSVSPKDVSRVSSKQAVASYPGFEIWVDSLVKEGGAQFGVVVVQRNGMLHTNREICCLDITHQHVTLRLPNAISLQQPYTAGMQVCGARGAGDAAAQGVFLALKPHEIYMLACETAKERNACIMLIRKMAALHGFSLTGPEEPMAGPDKWLPQ